MRAAKRAGLTASAVASILVLAGCGSSGNGNLLTQGAATQLTAELQQASTALGQYNCQVAYTALVNFKDDVNQLTGVNGTLVKILTDGASTISTLANERCPAGTSSATTTTDSATTTTTETTSSTSASVTTTSPETTTTTSDTSSSSGGAAPTTESTPATVTTPSVTTAGDSTTTPESGGAGLNSTGGSGGTGVAGADGQ